MAISAQAAMVHGWLICKGAVDRHVLYLRGNIKYHKRTLKRYNNCIKTRIMRYFGETWIVQLST